MSWIKKTLYAGINRWFVRGCTNYNSLEVRRSCRSKEQARSLFARHKVPHAQGLVFINPLRAFRFAREHGFPLVVKPNVGGFSRGSHFPITSYRQLLKAVLLVKIWWPVSVVERYLKGHNYRVLVANGEVVSVLHRHPPQVTGNGKDSIATLIDKENLVRQQMGLLPCMSLLKKNTAARRFLARSGYAFSTILAQGEIACLSPRIALKPGGTVDTLPVDQMADDTRELMCRLLGLFKANILGIDIIMEKGIEHSYKSQDCILLEVNSRPYVKMHNYPRRGEKQDLSTCLQKLESLDLTGSDTF